MNIRLLSVKIIQAIPAIIPAINPATAPIFQLFIFSNHFGGL
jgi:hypothetical protein